MRDGRGPYDSCQKACYFNVIFFLKKKKDGWRDIERSLKPSKYHVCVAIVNLLDIEII